MMRPHLSACPGPMLAGVIDRLVEKVLIGHQHNPDHHGRYVLSLTEEGKNQVERLREIGAAKIRGVLERMPDNALVSLEMGLEALIKALEEEGEMNGCH